MNSDEKPTLRLRIRDLLRAMDANDRDARSSRIATHLAAKIRGRIFGFAPMREEPNWLIAGWPGEIALPRVEGEHLIFHAVPALERLTTGRFGIREPDPDAAVQVLPDEGDTILVPGLAFDRRGGRLGRGGGFYDRFLERWPNAFRVGVAFSSQLIESVPCEAHDVRVDAVVTEDGWIDARSNRSGRD